MSIACYLTMNLTFISTKDTLLPHHNNGGVASRSSQKLSAIHISTELHVMRMRSLRNKHQHAGHGACAGTAGSSVADTYDPHPVRVQANTVMRARYCTAATLWTIP